MARRTLDRRTFLKGSAAAGLGFWVAGRDAWARGDAPATVSSPNEKLNVAFVGTANRAEANIHDAAGTGLINVVALCDVDANFLGKMGEKFPKAQRYADWRKMYEQKDIDAVLVATPDHTHAVATAAALHLGKHTYCEKPLTHTVREARTIAELATKQKRVTQMGTQIHAGNNYRRVVELVQAGAIGKIGEVHVWCSTRWSGDQGPRLPLPAQPLPANLDYELWVGPASFHPYNSAYLPASWRRYWAFGDGTLGDMACHYTDLPFWALDLRHPTRVSAEGPGPADAEGCPQWLIVKWEYAACGERPPVTLTWYDGGKRPPQFEEWGLNPKWSSGVMFVGDKGLLFADYNQHRLYPEKDFKDYQPPKPTIANSVGHHKEWVLACLKNDPAGTTCRFDYSGALTEAVLLGNVAYRAGKPIEWDAANLRIPNAPDAEQFLHYEYREGWTL